MSHSFSFDFQDADIEDEVDGDVREDRQKPHGVSSDHRETAPPVLHSLEELFQDLPERLEFSLHSVASNTNGSECITIPRRELFDIRVQLLRASGPGEIDPSTADTAVPGGDIQPGIYEGGFKTWECSLDLASYLLSALRAADLDLAGSELHVVELGSGTAVPTCALLHQLLLLEVPSDLPSSVHFTVADFNRTVLALAAAPNILLTCFTTDAPNTPRAGATDLDLTPDVLAAVCEKLSRSNITVRAISGAWGSAFETLCDFPRHQLSTSKSRARMALILASETIYSPESIASFTRTLLALMRKVRADEDGRCVAYVAAKQFYFGVGGSVDDFASVAQQAGAHVRNVWSSADQGSCGVGRCILEICLVE